MELVRIGADTGSRPSRRLKSELVDLRTVYGPVGKRQALTVLEIKAHSK